MGFSMTVAGTAPHPSPLPARADEGLTNKAGFTIEDEDDDSNCP
jgi:hypothetical protein